jgi:hypothetical protein
MFVECEKLYRRGKLMPNKSLDLTGTVVLSQGYSVLVKYMWGMLSVANNNMALLGFSTFP